MDYKKNKNYRIYILLFVLLIPLFLINIRDSHDWGDDFAQYIYQAKNIVQGIPQSEPCYIYDNPNFVSPTYSIGFPLILAPVYYFFGNNIKAFSIMLSIILFFLCFAIFLFYRGYFNNLVSVLLVLIFAYNPYTLNFKMEIMTDIPFAFVMMLTILAYFRLDKQKYSSYIMLGILTGLLISLRSIGVAIVIALVIERLIFIIRIKENPLKSLLNISILLLTSGVFFILLNVIIFKVPGAGIMGYSHVFIIANFFKEILENISFYITCFKNFFMSGITKIPFLIIITQTVILTFTILGFINSCIKKIGLIELFILCYLSIITIYPNKTLIIGMRYLFPILPLLFYYTAKGLQLIKIDFKINNNIKALLLGSFVLIPYTFSVSNIVKHQHKILHGPQEPESIEAFDYIKNNTPPNAIFVFFRARVLALYTGRKGTYSWYWTTAHETPEELHERFKKTGVNYILINSDLEDLGIELYIKKYPEKVRLVWQNAKFKLLSLNN